MPRLSVAEDVTDALQLALVPPLLPLHVQFHGPVPVTPDAVPAVQSLAVGAVVTATPFAEPQTPRTGEAPDCRGALHEEFIPPLLPSHIQAHGPVPVTAVAVPAVQNLVVGAIVRGTPFAGPQTPLTAVEASAAEQDVVVPPLLPAQLKFHCPVPVTADARPDLQSPLVGAILAATPFAGPHTPFNLCAFFCAATFCENVLHSETDCPCVGATKNATQNVAAKIVLIIVLFPLWLASKYTDDPHCGRDERFL
jgi:hypothetical protein